MLHAIAQIIHHAVFEQIHLGQSVFVCRQAKLEGGIQVDVSLEDACHIVVELTAIGADVHGDHSSVELVGSGVHLVFDEVEVGDRARVVILDGIRVEADKLYPSGNECEVGVAEHRSESFLARSQAVVVADKYYVGHLEPIQDVTLPEEFVGHAEVAQVASMNYKVDVVPAVHIVYEVLCLVVPSLRVAHKGKTQGIFLLTLRFDEGDVFLIDARFAVYAHIIRVIVYQVAAAGQRTTQEDRGQFTETIHINHVGLRGKVRTFVPVVIVLIFLIKGLNKAF